MDRTTYITNQVQKIRNEIKPVHLLAVTKYVSVEEAAVVYKCGQYDLGEARVTQLQDKSQYFLEHDFNKAVVPSHVIAHSLKSTVTPNSDSESVPAVTSQFVSTAIP